MATPGKATKKEKKKPVPVKTSLNNPYELKWKPLEKGHARFILKTVTDKLSSLDLRKQNVKVFRKWRAKKKAKKETSDSVDTVEPTQESRNQSSIKFTLNQGSSDSVNNAEPTLNQGSSDSLNNSKPTQNRGFSDSMDNAEPTQNRDSSDSVNKPNPPQELLNRGCSDSLNNVEPIQESQNRGWTNKSLRNELSIGINEVTKGLEKNELGLVLVCDSVKPAHMISHLISLSQTRSVPACQVPGLSASLAGSLGLTSVLALGFKRESGAFADTIAALVSKVPPLDVTWVPKWTGVSEPKVAQVSGKTEQQKCEEAPERGKKRKLADSPEVRKEVVTSLQPLKVKKIIPNPSKIRKPKIKKAKK
ncbi:Ribonuclease P protein subunit p38 [Bagarius yarrelli]|uniref:Ribonuclease P protein subunit p38 n=1 Tax=Bagarius yarrelli TaxID=175774 RepID=A0A556TLX8_BAGYA|nr:Ribonuclease P protein subunit p38 [Bagarius yarrelli]